MPFTADQLKNASFVKAAFPAADGYTEQLWVRVINVNSVVHGRLYSDPALLDRKRDDLVDVPFGSIIDMRLKTNVGIAEQLDSLT